MMPHSSPLRPLLLVTLALATAAPVAGQDTGVMSVDHYVPVRSIVPGMEGEIAQLYLRERTLPGTVLRGGDLEGRVVLFVHGAGTPAEVSFDVPAPGYSWMEHHAIAGFDAFSVDMTGYGRSTRPWPMNDPCNLPPEDQAAFAGTLARVPCEPSYPFLQTTIESDWADIDAAVEYIRRIRGVDRVSLVAWSLGGPRAGGYAARHPEKVDRLVLLAPAYNRNGALDRPADIPRPGLPMTLQSRSDFVSNWQRQAPCEGQYEQAVLEAVWAEMLASDPVGSTWGPGVRRAPRVTTWGWNPTVVARSTTPLLVVAPVHDGQVNPARGRELHEDSGATQKVLIDLGCSSHNAMWETNRQLLFDASAEWLTNGTVGGESAGVVRMGYE